MRTWREHMDEGGLDGWSNYAGGTDHAHLLVFLGRNRDSKTLAESNFEVGLAALGGESETVQVHRFRHWLVGWIELILIDPTDLEAVHKAEEMEERLADYPVLDEDDWSQREYDKAYEYWSGMSVCERIYWCRKCDVSIFSARRSDIPDDKTGELIQALAE